MKAKTIAPDCSGQEFFVGIDVHQRQWSITVRSQGKELRSLSIDPTAAALVGYLRSRYPGGVYKSVYEAGFSGYRAHRELRALGVDNIVVNAAEVPTRSKEKTMKSDAVDSRKLARELEHGSLTGIYVPDPAQESLRSLVRLRAQTVRSQRRAKQQIKSLLAYYGVETPGRDEVPHWSQAYIALLKEAQFEQSAARTTLLLALMRLERVCAERAEIDRALRREVAARQETARLMQNLQSVPGVGRITALTLCGEIMDMRRFSKADRLASWAGLIPTARSSGERRGTAILTRRHNAHLRPLLIEAAWVAARRDPSLSSKFQALRLRLDSRAAIVRVARILLGRIRSVWLSGKTYSSQPG